MNVDHMDSLVKDRDESALESYFDKGSRKPKEIFNISFRVIFLDYRKKPILFTDEYFHSIVKNKKKDVLNNRRQFHQKIGRGSSSCCISILK